MKIVVVVTAVVDVVDGAGVVASVVFSSIGVVSNWFSICSKSEPQLVNTKKEIKNTIFLVINVILNMKY